MIAFPVSIFWRKSESSSYQTSNTRVSKFCRLREERVHGFCMRGRFLWVAIKDQVVIMRSWYYMESGKRQGPIEEGRLTEMLENGTLGLGTMVWAKGLDEWIPASDVENLVPEDSLPPPIPDTELDAMPPPLPTDKTLPKCEGLEPRTNFWINISSGFITVLIIGLMLLFIKYLPPVFLSIIPVFLIVRIAILWTVGVAPTEKDIENLEFYSRQDTYYSRFTIWVCAFIVIAIVLFVLD